MKVKSTVFSVGLIVKQCFNNYVELEESAKNWHYLAKYRFSEGTFYGEHCGIQLPNMQFGYGCYDEGILFEGYAPKECISIILIEKNLGKICLNTFKMEEEDIILLDDSHSYSFLSSNKVRFSMLSIHKSLLQKEYTSLCQAEITLYEKSPFLLKFIQEKWEFILNYQEENKTLSYDTLENMQNEFLIILKQELIPRKPKKLSYGEKTSLKIKYFLLNSLEENISIEELCKQFNLSSKTLENSFKSLFGMTPKYFINLLKINKAHEDLERMKREKQNISSISLKWGFLHFGRFAKLHKEVFAHLPSQVVQKPFE